MTGAQPATASAAALLDLALDAAAEAWDIAIASPNPDPDRDIPAAMLVLRAIMSAEGQDAAAAVRARAGR